MGELVGVATGHPLLALALLLITAVCGVLRGWISHRTAVRHEEEATRRVRLAVSGTSSTERAAVVRACAELEAASHSAHQFSARTARESVTDDGGARGLLPGEVG
ncbi:MAG: hypothetical protein ABIZ05_18660 [Pseudonocardiaceae bacterium]